MKSKTCPPLWHLTAIPSQDSIFCSSIVVLITFHHCQYYCHHHCLVVLSYPLRVVIEGSLGKLLEAWLSQASICPSVHLSIHLPI